MLYIYIYCFPVQTCLIHLISLKIPDPPGIGPGWTAFPMPGTVGTWRLGLIEVNGTCSWENHRSIYVYQYHWIIMGLFIYIYIYHIMYIDIPLVMTD